RFLSMGEFAQALDEYARGVPAAGLSCVDAEPLEQALAEALLLLRTWGWKVGSGKFATRMQPALEAEPQLGAVLDYLTARSVADPPTEVLAARQAAALVGWGFLGQAYVQNRDHNFGRAETLLRHAVLRGDARDNILQASIAHQRGFLLYHTGRLDEALT